MRASVHGPLPPGTFVEGSGKSWSAISMPTPDSMSKARALLHRHWPVSTWDKFEACTEDVAKALDEEKVKPVKRVREPMRRGLTRLSHRAFRGTGVQ